MRRALPILLTPILAGCGNTNIPADANHPMLWWVGLTLGGALLSGAIWMLGGAVDRWQRRHERREDRGRG